LHAGPLFSSSVSLLMCAPPALVPICAGKTNKISAFRTGPESRTEAGGW
jgi:hypothetical protein